MKIEDISNEYFFNISSNLFNNSDGSPKFRQKITFI